MGKPSILLAAVVFVGLVLWIALDRPPSSEEQLTQEDEAATPAPEAQRDVRPEMDRTTRIEPAETEQDIKPATQAAPASPPQPTTATQPAPEGSAALPPPRASGPVAELKQAFEEEPRDSAAHDPELRIESEFRRSDIAPGTLRSALCRQSVCKVEVLWTPERATSFMAAFTRLSADFDPGMAIDPHDMAGAPQQLQVDVYLPRRGARAKAPDR